MFCFFFFKQKTAYEVRISDWSSDVCSSDLEPENNVHLTLEVFSEAAVPLIFIGNWKGSPYSRRLREKYGELTHIKLYDPIYDLNALSYLRRDRKSVV